MAKGGRRTYVRDNRGRFASTGATARGGRLKTAAGNKRKTVTTRMEGGKAAGTIRKPKGLKVSNVGAAAGRRKPLKGVNAAVKGNLAGFKGLPVSLRNKRQSISAQQKKNRQIIEATRGQVIGARRGVTATAGGGERVRISRGKSEQVNLLTGGTDRVIRRTVRPVPTSMSAAPGSKSRRRSFGVMTRKMESPQSALGRRRLRAAALESARRKATPYNNKKAAKTINTRGKALRYYESQKKR